LQEYADKFGTLTDDQALALAKKWLDVDIAAAQLRAQYLPIFAQAIGGKKAATFAQIDRRMHPHDRTAAERPHPAGAEPLARLGCDRFSAGYGG